MSPQSHTLPLIVLALSGLGHAGQAAPTGVTSSGQKLPPPYQTRSATKRSKVIGWPQGRAPKAPAGFRVNQFAANLDYPRNLVLLSNGDVLVSEARTVSNRPRKDRSRGESADRISLLRDSNHDGVADQKFTLLGPRNGMKQPFGILLLNNSLYIANTDSVMRFPYRLGQTRINGRGQTITTLPLGGYNNHWTRNLIASPDGKKIYISVGSASNVGEHGDIGLKTRAAILEMNPDGSGKRIFANGLRNPVGMDWNPQTKKLWTVVNERDELGDDLVPDYMAQVKDGGFYGWPFSYANKIEDPRLKGKRPDLVAKSLAPDFSLAPHSASLDMLFYRGNQFPAPYRNGAFVSQHGSWNRSEFTGYKVVFVPFRNGRPSGAEQDFLTGFIASEAQSTAYGRPMGLVTLNDGSLLVADDAANRIWRVSYQG